MWYYGIIKEKKIPSVVVQYVESGDGEEDLMSGLQSEKYTQEMLRAIFSGMYTVLTAALRQPGLKTEVWSNLSKHWAHKR